MPLGRLLKLGSIDVRTLALFRIGLSVLLLSDLYNRSLSLWAHYTDHGVYPRSYWVKSLSHQYSLSFHILQGNIYFQSLIFILATTLAIGLLVGYRTRLCTFLSWLLLASVQERNPLVLQAGDNLFLLLLFWAMFLPLNTTFSIDRALHQGPSLPSERKQVLSPASWSLLLQTSFLYFFSALLKDGPLWRENYHAVTYALSLEEFTTGIGQTLKSYIVFNQGLTFTTFWLELLGPFLVFLPWKTSAIRMIIASLFILFHLGLALTLKIGLFPFICILAWVPFLPPEFWNFLSRLLSRRKTSLKIYYDQECGFCKKVLFILAQFSLNPNLKIFPAQEDSIRQQEMQKENSWIVVSETTGKALYRYQALTEFFKHSPLFFPLAVISRLPFMQTLGDFGYRWVANHRHFAGKIISFLKWKEVSLKTPRWMHIFAFICLTYIFLWNVRTVSFQQVEKFFPKSINWFGYALHLDQYWNMFAPAPGNSDGWYVIIGKFENGKTHNLFTNQAEVSWDKPKNLSSLYPSQRWRKYMRNIRQRKHAHLRQFYGTYLCRKWNHDAQKGERLHYLNIYFMEEKTLAPGKESPPQKIHLLKDYYCFHYPKRKDQSANDEK